MRKALLMFFHYASREVLSGKVEGDCLRDEGLKGASASAGVLSQFHGCFGISISTGADVAEPTHKSAGYLILGSSLGVFTVGS